MRVPAQLYHCFTTHRRRRSLPASPPALGARDLTPAPREAGKPGLTGDRPPLSGETVGFTIRATNRAILSMEWCPNPLSGRDQPVPPTIVRRRIVPFIAIKPPRDCDP
jgi:hypothetical protein